jgi:hypothetical protein
MQDKVIFPEPSFVTQLLHAAYSRYQKFRLQLQIWLTTALAGAYVQRLFFMGVVTMQSNALNITSDVSLRLRASASVIRQPRMTRVERVQGQRATYTIDDHLWRYSFQEDAYRRKTCGEEAEKGFELQPGHHAGDDH